MPSSWTRSDLRAGIEKGSLLLLLSLLGLYWLVNCHSGSDGIPQMSQIVPKDAYQRITLGQKIDINRESEEGLMAIPKMTQKMARQIVGYREVYGPIRDKGDILKALGSKYKERIPEIMNYIELGMS